MGVRVQIQDLRNYADTNSRAANMHNPPVPQWYGSPASTRSTAAHNFDHFFRKGLAPTWNQMGNGNHATSPIYGPVVISMYQNMLTFNGLPAGRGGRRRPGREPRAASAGSRWRAHQGLDRRPVEEQPDCGGRLRERHRLRAHHRERQPAGRRRRVRRRRRRPWLRRDAADPRRRRSASTRSTSAPGPATRCSGAARCPGRIPTANIDPSAAQPDGLHLRGWTLDPDSAGPTHLDVYANGRGVAAPHRERRPARTSARPSPATAPRTGSMRVLPGRRRQRLRLRDQPRLRLQPVARVPGFLAATPIGSLDTATRMPDGIHVTGWALDADTTASTMVDIYANGVGLSPASPQARPATTSARCYPHTGSRPGLRLLGPDRGRPGVRCTASTRGRAATSCWGAATPDRRLIGDRTFDRTSTRPSR